MATVEAVSLLAVAVTAIMEAVSSFGGVGSGNNKGSFFVVDDGSGDYGGSLFFDGGSG